jgi:hypothetical protein
MDLGPLRGKDLVFGAGAALRPGNYACRLVIRNMASGLSAVASTKATVGKQQMTALALGTPLILGPGTGRTFLYAGAKKAKAAFPWAEIYPFDGSLFSPALGDVPRHAASVLAVVPCAVPGGGKPQLGSRPISSTRGQAPGRTFPLSVPIASPRGRWRS